MLTSFSFWLLFGFFLSSHKHLLLGFHGWAFLVDGRQNRTQARETNIKTLPYFVGDLIIKAQQIVCQEKNIILQNKFSNRSSCIDFHQEQFWRIRRNDEAPSGNDNQQAVLFVKI